MPAIAKHRIAARDSLRGLVLSTAAITATRVTLDALYRTESRRVLATLIRLLGDFDLAEEALSEAFWKWKIFTPSCRE